MSLALVGIALLLGACGVQPITRTPVTASGEPVEVAILKAVYESEGHGRAVLFIDVPEVSDPEADEIAQRLSEDLGVVVRQADEALRDDPDLPVLTPYDPQTGEVGLVVRLQSVARVEPSGVQAYVTYARSGLDGGGISLTLVQNDDGWEVVGGSYDFVARRIDRTSASEGPQLAHRTAAARSPDESGSLGSGPICGSRRMPSLESAVGSEPGAGTAAVRSLG